MGQSEFNFDGFLEERAKRQEEEIAALRGGLEEYEKQLDVLETQRVELDEQIEQVSEKIDKIKSMLANDEEQHQEETPQRDRGVLIVLRQIVSEWTNHAVYHEFDEIVKKVRKIKPTAKESTIRSGLARLVQTGILEVEGKRGNRMWAPSLEQSVEQVIENSDDELIPEKLEHVGKETIFVQDSYDEIVAKVIEQVFKTLKKNADGIGAKTILWIMEKTGADEAHFEAAIKQLESEEKVEVAKSLKNDSQVIRLPADPDSKEALKRVRVHGKRLFPGMDEPSHA